MRIAYKPSFVRGLKSLESRLQNEVYEKIELFKNPENHRALHVHKLKGGLKGCLSFSVNFKYRIVFMYESKNSAIFLLIGDHTVYEK